MKIDLKKLFIFPNATGRTKASADITIGGLVTVYGCSLVESKDGGFFVGMPQKKDKNDDNKFWAIVYIESKELMEEIRRVVVDAYKAKVESAPVSSGDNGDAWQE